jgi:hypothetical protein
LLLQDVLLLEKVSPLGVACASRLMDSSAQQRMSRAAIAAHFAGMNFMVVVS